MSFAPILFFGSEVDGGIYVSANAHLYNSFTSFYSGKVTGVKIFGYEGGKIKVDLWDEDDKLIAKSIEKEIIFVGGPPNFPICVTEINFLEPADVSENSNYKIGYIIDTDGVVMIATGAGLMYRAVNYIDYESPNNLPGTYLGPLNYISSIAVYGHKPPIISTLDANEYSQGDLVRIYGNDFIDSYGNPLAIISPVNDSENNRAISCEPIYSDDNFSIIQLPYLVPGNYFVFIKTSLDLNSNGKPLSVRIGGKMANIDLFTDDEVSGIGIGPEHGVAKQRINDLITKVNGMDSASEFPYTPTTGADWTDPDPTTIQGALDALAGRVSTNETDIGTNETDIGTLETTVGAISDDHVRATLTGLAIQTDESEVSAALSGDLSKAFTPSEIVVVCTAVSGTINANGTINVGTTSGNNDILSAGTLTGIDAVGKSRRFPLTSATYNILGNATLYANVEAPETGASANLVLSIFVLGRQF